MSKTVASLEILKSLSNATADVVEKVASSVVSVSCGIARGSGVVWSADGYIVTCSHVIGRRRSILVGLGDGNTLEAKVVGSDSYADVALLKIDGKALKPVEVGDSESLKAGQFVLALANPFNRKPSATIGIVTSVTGSVRGFGGVAMENVIVTDTQSTLGYSGGPLVDASGKMIGLNAAYAWSRGIAIPVDLIKSLADGLMHEGRIKRAYLGIQAGTIPLPADVAGLTGVDQDTGVLVLSVERNSAARKAGLALGDVIIKFDEKPISTLYDLTKLLSAGMIEKQAKLGILRGEQLMELTVTPGVARDENDE
ncbi:MAG TPA: trypsin-like peptidase domain-containing protein [Candidatus Bathyarchaeia archaeon]|nr:trypsin-like peptidase domain-containing protein [Candidatus Bathyarchaeia archaeon]